MNSMQWPGTSLIRDESGDPSETFIAIGSNGLEGSVSAVPLVGKFHDNGAFDTADVTVLLINRNPLPHTDSIADRNVDAIALFTNGTGDELTPGVPESRSGTRDGAHPHAAVGRCVATNTTKARIRGWGTQGPER